MEKSMTETQSATGWEPKIVAIVCNWCTYAGADLAGISRIQYPPNVRIVRVPCTGRINPFYILKAAGGGRGAGPGATRVSATSSPETWRPAGSSPR
jgi:hypothetical protein